jgi:hypothetical protein
VLKKSIIKKKYQSYQNYRFRTRMRDESTRMRVELTRMRVELALMRVESTRMYVIVFFKRPQLYAWQLRFIFIF